MSSTFADYLRSSLAGTISQGCSEAEIAELESACDARFPSDYREFLLCAGRRAGNLWIGSDYRYDELLDNQEAGVELLADAGLELPKGAIVFLMHQGYQFFYLAADGVYYYHEGRQAPVKESDSFAEFFETMRNGW